MGQEEYLNNLLDSIIDEKEERDKAKKKEDNEILLDIFADEEEGVIIDMLANKEEGAVIDMYTDEEEESFSNMFGDRNEEPIIDVFANEEEEPLVDVFANEEEEPLIDVFANEEEEPLVDVFANEEEEPLVDIFANEEEEPLVDVFANEEEEPLIDIFANEEEEPLVDVFANEEEEPLIDVFANEEESLTDLFGNDEQVTSENLFMKEDQSNEDSIIIDDFTFEKESGSLLNSINDILGSLDEEEQESDSYDSGTTESDDTNDEDIFAMLGESKEMIDFESTTKDSANESLFDDDLMKLLGEEDFSSEEVFLSADETEAELAKDRDTKIEQDLKNEKKNKKPGLLAKLFNGKENQKTAENKEEVTDDLEVKEKKKKEKRIKPQKEKKAKKEKKPKKEKVKKPEIIEEPSTPLHKGQVVSIFVLCVSIAIFIISASSLVPYSISISTAKGYYEKEEYAKAYYELEGLKISNNDLAFYNKLETIMFVKNQLDSYYTYEKIGLNQEAISALLKGVSKYDEHYVQAQQYDVVSYYDRALGQIENELAEKYNVTLDMARTINMAEDASSYSAQINNITSGY